MWNLKNKQTMKNIILSAEQLIFSKYLDWQMLQGHCTIDAGYQNTAGAPECTIPDRIASNSFCQSFCHYKTQWTLATFLSRSEMRKSFWRSIEGLIGSNTIFHFHDWRKHPYTFSRYSSKLFSSLLKSVSSHPPVQYQAQYKDFS